MNKKKRKRMISRKLSNNLHCHFHHLLPHPQDEKNQDPEIHRNYEILPLTSTNKKKRQSLPQTRLHFQSILSGFTPSDQEALIDWPTDTAPHIPSNYYVSHLAAAGLEVPLGGEGRRKCSTTASSGKGKEREGGRGSLGGEGGGRKSLGRESPRGSLGGAGEGSGSGKKKRKSGAGIGS